MMTFMITNNDSERNDLINVLRFKKEIPFMPI